MANNFNLSLRNLTYRLRKYKEILAQELEKVILEHEDTILDMIQDQLYNHGITGRGIEIMSYAPYRPRTIAYKRKKGQPTDHVTLKDTGKFYRRMEVKFDSAGFYITSYDTKTERLTKKYGVTIFRLTNENLNRLIRDYLRPSLQQRFKEYLKNG